jgi:hypothetical protein
MTIKVRFGILIAMLLFVSWPLFADTSTDILQQLDDEKSAVQAQKQEEMYSPIAEFRATQEQNRFYLLIVLLIVMPLSLLLVLWFIKKSEDYTERSVINASGLVLVIQATTFVVIASPTTEQLTAAIGVLGAIAGYLFGSARTSHEAKPNGRNSSDE